MEQTAKIEAFPWEQAVKEKAISYLEKGKPDWDVPHTLRVVYWMKELIKNGQGDPKVLLPAAYFHDIGYSLCSMDNADYDSVQEVKERHSILGAKESEKILQEISGFSEADISEVVHLVRVHDQLENLTTDNEIMICEADTLGMMNVEAVKPSYVGSDFKRFLDDLIKRRAPLFRTAFGKEMLQNLLAKAEEYARNS